MIREDALAPLVEYGEARFKFEAGALVRGATRQFLVRNGYDYYEEKGFLASLFVVRGEADRIIALRDHMKNHF